MGVYDIMNNKKYRVKPLGEYHTFIRDNRKAIVLRNAMGFYVEMYDTDELIETREVYEHSEPYAESLAENWVDMVIA